MRWVTLRSYEMREREKNFERRKVHHVHQNRGPSVDQPVEASVVNLAIQPSPTITTFTTGHFITGSKLVLSCGMGNPVASAHYGRS